MILQGILKQADYRHWPGVILCLFLLLPLAAPAQDSAGPAGQDGEEQEQEYDNSQHVDESEENYRARMELRDQRYQDTPRINTTYAPSTATEIIDGLPLASQEHIKAQLRNMIIESRQWEPGEDLTDYPYEPSAEAQSNTALRNKEREAWVEQLQKFQEREAAAYANAAGGQQGAPQQGQQNQQGQQGQKGRQDFSDKASGQQQRMAGTSPGASGRGTTDEPPPSTAGVSESALSFLRGKSGPGGPLEQGNGANGGLAESDPGPTGDDGTELAAGSTEGRGEDEGAQQSAPGSSSPMPGTLEIGELAMLQGLSGQPGGTSVTGSGASGASGRPQGEPGQMQQPGPAGGTGAGSEGRQFSQAADPAQQVRVELTSADESSSSASVEQAADERIEITREVIIEPGTIDIAELKQLEGN